MATYTVKRGDTLSEIAQQYKTSGYSTYSYMKKLVEWNDISNPDKIAVGQVLVVTNGTTKSKTNNTNKAVIMQFGELASNPGTLFATWKWTKSNTENYETQWQYHDSRAGWLSGSKGTTDAKESTYNVPQGATKVRFRVKPISKKRTVNNKETSYWTAEWSSYKTYDTSDLKPDTPSTPTLTIDNLKATVSIDNVESNTTHIQFRIVKNDTGTVYTSIPIKLNKKYASHVWNVEAGNKYKATCRAHNWNSGTYSDWSAWTSNVNTRPSAPKSITELYAYSSDEIYIAWNKVNTAKSYIIEYTTDKNYFDASAEQVKSITVEATNTHAIISVDTGDEYFFRVAAAGESADTNSPWTAIKSCVAGKQPAAPTTWSSITSAIVGEKIYLYWMHNSRDNSTKKHSWVSMHVNGETLASKVIDHTADTEDEENNPGVYIIDTSVNSLEGNKIEWNEGVTIEWRVKTAGVLTYDTGAPYYSDWSVARTITVYAPPTLSVSVTNSDELAMDTVTSFPFYITGTAGPDSSIQKPIAYHLSIIANGSYETEDDVGNKTVVNAGETIYSKLEDYTGLEATYKLSADNIDLENNIEYTAICEVTMDSGLSATASTVFTVSWEDMEYIPNAEINVDTESLTASIRPFCEVVTSTNYRYFQVNKKPSGAYVKTEIELYNMEVANSEEETALPMTTTGEIVYISTTGVYFCEIEESVTELTDDALLSVYRREFDGTFTEIATDIDNLTNTFVTDPHPALDYARYRIVSKSKSTGGISFYDMPGYIVGETAIVIQWDEEWSSFDAVADNVADELVERPWTGSMLKLPYNIDISDSYSPDVNHVSYIGRSHPVSYFGTQIGSTSSWSTEIPKSDKETLYALRRLAIYMGNVYVREPSGSGYWATINLQFPQKHCEVTIPVTIDITRVEGGI